MSDESRFVGCIVGLAVGDALGYPAEFRSRDQILREIGPKGIVDFIALQDSRFSRPVFVGGYSPAAIFTDDTQMTIAVAEALVASGGGLAAGVEPAALDRLMNDMCRRFVAWSRSEQNNRAPGGTCMSGCRNLEAGLPWRQSGIADSKGCGSVMRVAPIGLFYDDLDIVAEVARASSLPTHGHDAALEGAAAAALLVALALRVASPEEMYAVIDERCTASSPDFAAIWRRLPEMIRWPPEAALSEAGLGEGWVAEEAVASAMYCYWRSPHDYRQAVLTAVNTDGDSDSIAAITGSISGARLGLESIPAHWRGEVEDSEYLHELGRRLWAASR